MFPMMTGGSSLNCSRTETRVTEQQSRPNKPCLERDKESKLHSKQCIKTAWRNRFNAPQRKVSEKILPTLTRADRTLFLESTTLHCDMDNNRTKSLLYGSAFSVQELPVQVFDGDRDNKNISQFLLMSKVTDCMCVAVYLWPFMVRFLQQTISPSANTFHLRCSYENRVLKQKVHMKHILKTFFLFF